MKNRQEIMYFKTKTANLAGMLALACAVISLEYATVNAQQLQNAKCSFWMSDGHGGNLLSTELEIHRSCRTRWNNGRVTTIEYNSPGKPVTPYPFTASAWEKGWVPGRSPNCLAHPLTGIYVCQK